MSRICSVFEPAIQVDCENSYQIFQKSYAANLNFPLAANGKRSENTIHSCSRGGGNPGGSSGGAGVQQPGAARRVHLVAFEQAIAGAGARRAAEAEQLSGDDGIES